MRPLIFNTQLVCRRKTKIILKQKDCQATVKLMMSLKTEYVLSRRNRNLFFFLRKPSENIENTELKLNLHKNFKLEFQNLCDCRIAGNWHAFMYRTSDDIYIFNYLAFSFLVILQRKAAKALMKN